MKILVPIKRVIDPYVRIRVKKDQTGVETQNIKMAINPFDEIALEEAIRCKDKGLASEVIVISIGGTDVQESLRAALALGADKAELIESAQASEPLSVAKVLKSLVEKHQIDFVIMGKQSIDGDNNQTGQMLAALLDWPQGTFVSELVISEGAVEVTREVDGGLETLKLNLPAVITTDLRLNEPRYATLPNIMKAKRKPLEIITLESLSLNLGHHCDVTKVVSPPERSPGVRLSSTEELVNKLLNEDRVI